MTLETQKESSFVLQTLRSLWKLSWPISLAQLALMSLGMIDTAIVGHTSVTALAGCSIGRSIGFALSCFALGLSSVLETIASQALGRRKPEQAWHALQLVLLANLLLMPLLILSVFAALYTLPWIGISTPIAHEARSFLYGHMPGIYGFSGFIAAKNFLQAHQKTRSILISSIFANGINYVLCKTLVVKSFLFPLGLGSFGAGLASSLSSYFLFGCVFLAAWFLESSRKNEQTDFEKNTPSLRSSEPSLPSEKNTTDGAEPPEAPLHLKSIFILGLPLGFQLFAEVGAFSTAAVLAGKFGENAASAHQIALMLASFTFMGASGISSGTSVFVGKAVGEGRLAQKEGIIGMALGTFVMILGALVFAIAPRALVSLFSEESEVLSLGVNLLYIASIFQIFDGLQVVSAGALRGLGDFQFPFFANVFAHWAIGFPIALFCAFYLRLGPLGLWLGLTSGLIVISILLSLRFWKLSKNLVKPVLKNESL